MSLVDWILAFVLRLAANALQRSEYAHHSFVDVTPREGFVPCDHPGCVALMELIDGAAQLDPAPLLARVPLRTPAVLPRARHRMPVSPRSSEVFGGYAAADGRVLVLKRSRGDGRLVWRGTREDG